MKRLKYTLIVFLLFTFWSCSDWSGTPDNEIRPVTYINEVIVTPDTVDIGEPVKLEVKYQDQNNPAFLVYWSPTIVNRSDFTFKRDQPSYLIPINGRYDSSAVFFDTNYFTDTTLSEIRIRRMYVYVADTTETNFSSTRASRFFSFFINY